jgi:oligopeptide/dipeptide ABC transporter ATP-binding protein
LFSSRRIVAVNDVSFAIKAARPEIFTIIGESGSGKTTLSRMILNIERPTSGALVFDGIDLATVRSTRDRMAFMHKAQPIFQNPFEAFNPLKQLDRYLFMTRRRFLAAGDQQGIEVAVDEALRKVGLSLREVRQRYPHELSGGQQQRVGIARALAPNPELVVLDEPTSALDVSVQAKLINLLRRLKEEFDLTQVFISHDLSVIGYLTDRVAVMYLGEVVELGPTAEIFLKPRHPYTGALMSAVPGDDLLDRRTRLMLPGEVPSPIKPPPACRLAPRCPFAKDRCRQEKQVLRQVGTDHAVACWRAADGEISTEDFERTRLALEA